MLRLTRIMASKPNVIFILGAPGSGKGTQCAKLVEKHGYHHLSAGDLLRQERKNPESKVGQLIEDICLAGKIVPDEITCSLLEKAINGAIQKQGADSATQNNFLIDGYPRNTDNYEGWYKNMGDKTNTKCVLFFDLKEEQCIERIMKRAAIEGRFDDDVEVLKRRFRTFYSDSMPIVDRFEEKGLVRRIDSMGTPDEVFARVEAHF